ncbi:MAG: outer membrane protein transport protein [Deltaproteobacteria bacterium]|nr:outer membrane protein transport protein [Deltaproteobacteria bacterium]
MTKAIIVRSAAILALALIPAPALANGFFIYEVSAAGVGMGGAQMAGTDEPSAVFYNPAAMTHLPGVQFQLTLTTYIPTAEHVSPTGLSESASAMPQPVPALFATWKPLSWLAAGFGMYTAFGLSIEWPDDWSGSFLAVESSLQSTQLQPSIAFGPWHGLSIGGGFDFLLGSVEIRRAYPGLRLDDGTPARMRLGGNSWGWGTNLGIHYTPIDLLSLAVIYRSQIQVKLDPGAVDFTFPASFSGMLNDQDVKTGITVPQILGAGARLKPIGDLALEFDAVYAFWSSYNKLVFEFSEMAPAESVKNWSDAWQFRLGGQYRIKKWTVRTGIILDLDPIPDESLDPMLPDATRIDVSAGGGYSFGTFNVDLAYMYVYVFDRTVDESQNVFPGTYKSTVHVVSLGAGAKF